MYSLAILMKYFLKDNKFSVSSGCFSNNIHMMNNFCLITLYFGPVALYCKNKFIVIVIISCYIMTYGISR